MRSERYRLGELELDATGLEVRRGSEALPIRRLPLRLLIHLVRHRDRVVGKQELDDTLWPGVAVSDAALTSAVRDLRRALGESGPRWIATRRGSGYRFTGPVEEVTTDAAPPASRPQRADDEPFVGRADVLSDLDAALERASAGRGELVLVAGEAGIGKTRLAEVLSRRAEARGFEVLVGRCLETEGAPPFWPWLQILRELLARRSPAALREELGARAVDVARMLPELAERLPGLAQPAPLDPRPARFRFLDAATQLLVRARPGRRRLLVLDDLHRADPSSLELLEHLVGSLDGSSVLVMGTYRDTDVGRDAEVASLLGRLGRRGETELLGTLGRGDVALYCALTLGQAQDEAVVDSLAERSGGNPFLLKLLVALRRRRGPASDSARLPTGLAEAVLAQLDALVPEGRQLLRVASVFGREFRPTALAHAAGVGLESVLTLLDAAEEQRLVTRDDLAGTRRFVHALVGEVLYGALSATERIDLHGRAGLALEAVLGTEGEHAAELAHHYAEAAHAGFGERAVAACQRAAERALRKLAYEESTRLLRRSLALLDALPAAARSDRELELSLVLGVALFAGRGYGSPETLAVWERARELCDPAIDPLRSARIHYYIGFGEWNRGRMGPALEGASRALEIGDAQGSELLIIAGCAGRALPLLYMGRIPESLAASQRAAALYDPGRHRFRDAGFLADAGIVALAFASYSLWYAGHPTRAAAACTRMIELARATGHPYELAYALATASVTYLYRRDWEQVTRLGAEAAAIASEYGFSLLEGMGRMTHALADGLGADDPCALERFSTAMAMSASAFGQAGAPAALSFMAQLQLRAGRPEEAFATARGGLELAARTEQHFRDAELLRAEGEALRSAGADPKEVEARFERALETARSQGARSLELRAATSLARLLAETSRPGEALALLAPVLAGFEEGFDTLDLQEAQALLDALGCASRPPAEGHG